MRTCDSRYQFNLSGGNAPKIFVLSSSWRTALWKSTQECCLQFGTDTLLLPPPNAQNNHMHTCTDIHTVLVHNTPESKALIIIILIIFFAWKLKQLCCFWIQMCFDIPQIPCTHTDEDLLVETHWHFYCMFRYSN